MMATYPTARTIKRALGVFERLPTEALFDLAERLIDRLDAVEPDPDLEPEEDACDAGECGGLELCGDRLPGDASDAEPDDDDRGLDEGEPQFPDTLRAGRDGVVHVRRQTIMAVLYRRGRPARAQRMRCIQWEGAR